MQCLEANSNLDSLTIPITVAINTNKVPVKFTVQGDTPWLNCQGLWLVAVLG